MANNFLRLFCFFILLPNFAVCVFISYLSLKSISISNSYLNLILILIALKYILEIKSHVYNLTIRNKIKFILAEQTTKLKKNIVDNHSVLVIVEYIFTTCMICGCFGFCFWWLAEELTLFKWHFTFIVASVFLAVMFCSCIIHPEHYYFLHSQFLTPDSKNDSLMKNI